jgi:hypothetical protein
MAVRYFLVCGSEDDIDSVLVATDGAFGEVAKVFVV